MPKRIWFTRIRGQTRNLWIPLLIFDEANFDHAPANGHTVCFSVPS